MRLAAIVESVDHVCARYRVRAFAARWAAAGVSLDLVPYPARWMDRARFALTLGGYDAVILQRRLLPRWLLGGLRRAVKRLVFDFDDAVFLRDSYSRRGPHSLRRAMRFAATVQVADAVVAGNDWLAERARGVAGCAPVTVIPTCVEPAAYPIAAQTGPPRLVWIGSGSTLQGLAPIRPWLTEAARRVPDLELVVICDRPFDVPGVCVIARPWADATEAAELAAASVGIAHVPDDDWSRGKCGLKVLQYMAAGLPVVANPVGVHSLLVAPGVTGYLASTDDSWVDAVARLAADASLRTRLGAAGRRAAEARYSVASGADRWLNVLRTVAATRAA